jgi:predicted nucleic acid-binding protein
MKILVDSSVWIDYFRSGKNSELLDLCIDQNLICINDLILAELIPYLKINNQNNVIRLLNNITNIELNINWKNIIEYQIICIKNGINKIGIPYLIIVDNIIQNNLTLFTLDKHFYLIKKHILIDLINK